MSAPAGTTDAVLTCGEVRTCLLPCLQPLDLRAAAHLLRLRPDERVRTSERPNVHALSPETLTGVECRLPTSDGVKTRAVGTVTARAALTEGRVLQTTAYMRAPAAGPDRRRPWGHYLVRPGIVEPLGRMPAQAVAEGVLTGAGDGELDLGLIADGLITRLLRHPLLDQKVPFTSRHTRLRWAALRAPEGEGAALVRFVLAEEDLRAVELRVPATVEPSAVVGLCEDLALHDWLLTTLVRMLDGSRLGSPDGPAAVLALRPAVSHLLHLWMPGARVDPDLASVWEVLERRPGFSRQWRTQVQRIRDQLALQAIPLPHEALTAR
ncbi:SCO2521 family protein [Streptomyces sp. bgisy032]|uniref:SCO2521 family protein n=1 Tax=Streptomyces sp. bgisy032 TaxID=3413773 RepID=UPI003D73FE8A